MPVIRQLFLLLGVLCFFGCSQKEDTTVVADHSAKSTFTTYCNPVDIDYSYMSHYAHRRVSYRSGADPAVVNFKGKYYMFVTRSHGYWVSDDLSDWQFVRPESWYFGGSNAPSVAVRGDKMIAYGDPSGRGPILESTAPDKGQWETTFNVLPLSIQDPCLFVDDDGRVYLYEESSNLWPIRVIELDTSHYYSPIGQQKDLFNLDPEAHGWERFGQDHRSDIKPYLEGPWVTKHGDTYYLEYSAPGTQWNVYADGVYTSKSPMGPFEYAPYNPISYKPGGFLTGAGHGSTMIDNDDQYWHFASMPISVNYKFERRIGLFPAGIDDDGQMWVNTAYGDYPHYLPTGNVEDHQQRFTGWMLLSYKKPIKVSSQLKDVQPNIVDESDSGFMLAQEEAGYGPTSINDENIRTYWVAEDNAADITVTIDLESVKTVRAVQINFNDYNSQIYGRPDTLVHQFVIEGSDDGDTWQVVADYSDNARDQPHAYVELKEAVDIRYIRYRNVHISQDYLSISEFRVFGKASGPAPTPVEGFTAVRQEDSRNADLSWTPVGNATGYVVYWGITPDKLNNSVMVYDTSYELRALDVGQQYFLRIEAFGETGVSAPSSTVNI